MSRHVGAFVFVIMAPGLVAGAWAQERGIDSRLAFVPASSVPPVAAFSMPAGDRAAAVEDAGQVQGPVATNRPLPVQIVQPYRRIQTGDSPLMMSLYLSTAVTQALDIHSTIKALDRGAVETNPVLSGLTGNKAAFIAVKGAVAASSIYAARKMAKRNKAAAIATLVAINTAYGLVAHHNYQVAGRLR